MVLSNELSLKAEKLILLNFKFRIASTVEIVVIELTIKSIEYSSFLGVLVNGKLKLYLHVNGIKPKVAGPSEIEAKMRNFVPKGFVEVIHSLQR